MGVRSAHITRRTGEPFTGGRGRRDTKPAKETLTGHEGPETSATSMLGIANKAQSDQKHHSGLAAEASIHEEPGAGKPHAGISARAVG